MRKLNWILLLSLVICSIISCKQKREEITLSMWHNYGGEMQKSMDSLIEEFNTSVGNDKGITINVTAISSSKELNKALLSIAQEEPGAPSMPDITTAYPQNAIIFKKSGKLANLYNYLDQSTIDKYVSPFLKEGEIDKGLYVFPLAKSSEVLYLNQTLFDEFCSATGFNNSDLATFEGLLEIATSYYKWCGKSFFTADSFFNLTLVGMEQLGEPLIVNEHLNTESKNYQYILKLLYDAIKNKGVTLYDGYSSDLSKTGDIAASTGSSAGILFYGNTITYPDNRVEEVEYSILPYPIFKAGNKIAMQRGGGLMVSASTKEREEASLTFIKWLTEPKQNLKFITSTGYLPVTIDAYKEEMASHIQKIEDERIKKMLVTVTGMQEEYTFFSPQIFENFDSLSKAFKTNFKKAMQANSFNEALAIMGSL